MSDIAAADSTAADPAAAARIASRLPPAMRTSLAARWLRALREGIGYGAAYAAINFFTASPRLIDPEWSWRFFTREQPALFKWFIYNYPFPARRKAIIDAYFARTHADGIEYHYDLSNAFYRLFLDRRFMFYSCADFNHPGETLEDAQLNKANHLLSLIDPKPGERILELGCGWGSMLRHIHGATGDRENLTGYTLSKEQKRHIEENFGFNVVLDDFITADLGTEAYDKIYSIGALEHVRPEEILPLLTRVHRALKPGGRLVQHFFSLNGTDPLPTPMISCQLFFPGTRLALHSDHLAFARQAGFRLIHDSQHDYRPTLRAWYDRLVENRDRAVELVGIQQVNKYLSFFATSWTMFNDGKATLHRLVLVKD